MTPLPLTETLHEAGAHYRCGRLPEAAAAYRRVLRDHPDHLLATVNLGIVLRLLGQFTDALACCRRALVIEPARFEALSSMGLTAHWMRAAEPAASALTRAVRVDPTVPTGQSRLGAVLLDLGRVAEARAAFENAIALHPTNGGNYSLRANALHSVGAGVAALASYRRHVLVDLHSASALNNLGGALQSAGDFVAAEACFRSALQVMPGYVQAHSNLLMAMNYDAARSEEDLFQEHRGYDSRMSRLYPAARARHANDADPDRRLRIGYVSADFGRHPTGYFLLPVLTTHDARAVEVYAYSSRAVEDDLTARLRERATVWRDVAGIDDATLTEQIRADGIDVLVDLSGHTAGNRLPVFHMEPAPVQVSWLGYFNTTGLTAIQAVLMDAVTVPPGAERWFTEEVVRLPGGRFCYAPPDYAPPIAEPPLLRCGHPTFGSFNNIAKLSGPTVGLWAALLDRVPDARLVLKWKTLADPEMRDRVLVAFAQAGADVGRIELRSASPHPAMLAEYGDIDIALDPSPFGGGLTSYEAMWMGVPVVTQPGLRPVSRQTAALLAALNLPELVCASPEQFIDTAARLAGDAERLRSLRFGMRECMRSSTVCDGAAFTRNLEAVYRDLWRRWCAAAA